jgi:hypothetical protein
MPAGNSRGDASTEAHAIAAPASDESPGGTPKASPASINSPSEDAEPVPGDGQGVAVPEAGQRELMEALDSADTAEQRQFSALVRKAPKQPRAKVARDKAALAWIKRVSQTVSNLHHSREWPAKCDAMTLPARLWLIREALVQLVDKAPGEFGIMFPGPVAQQLLTLLQLVIGTIRVTSMTRAGEERFGGELRPRAGAVVREQLSDSAEKREAAAPDFLELFSPIQDPTVGVDAALGGVARFLLDYLPHPEGFVAAINSEEN